MSNDELKRLFESPNKGHLWGQEHDISPRLIEKVYGDGKKFIHVTPLFSRPNYYVLRVDSNMEFDDEWFHSEEWIYDIEDEFGNHEEEFHYCEEIPQHRDWPAWHDGGYQYGLMRDQPLLTVSSAQHNPHK